MECPGFHVAQSMPETADESSCVGSSVSHCQLFCVSGTGLRVGHSELSCQQPGGENRARLTSGFSFLLAVQKKKVGCVVAQDRLLRFFPLARN